MSSKIEKICEEKSPGEQKSSSEQIEAFNEIQKFMSDSSDCDNLHKDFNSFCNSMAEQDDTWHFWREFVAKSMLPYLGLYLSIRSEQWDLRLASLKMMAPIFHAFDSSNYINIIPNHIAEMLCLPPSLLEHFNPLRAAGEIFHRTPTSLSHGRRNFPPENICVIFCEFCAGKKHHSSAYGSSLNSP